MGLLSDLLELSQKTEHPGLEDISEARHNRALPYEERADLLRKGMAALADPEDADALDRRAAIGGGLAGAMAAGGVPAALRPLAALKPKADQGVTKAALEATQSQLDELQRVWASLPTEAKKGVTPPVQGLLAKLRKEGVDATPALTSIGPVKASPGEFINRLARGPLGAMGITERQAAEIAADTVRRAHVDLAAALDARGRTDVARLFQRGSAGAALDNASNILRGDLTAAFPRNIIAGLTGLAKKVTKTPFAVRAGVLAPSGAVLGALAGYQGSQRRQAEAAAELEGMEDVVEYLRQLDREEARGRMSAEAPAATQVLQQIKKGVGDARGALTPMLGG